MGKTIGSVLTLQDKFSPTLGKIGNNIGGFNRKLGNANSNINRMASNFSNSFNKMNNVAGSAFKGLGTKVAGLAAWVGLVNFAKDSVMLASDLAEVENVVTTTFEKSTSKINDFAKSSMESFGLTELQAKQFNGTLGAMMKTAGFSGDELAKMTTDLSGLSGDIASFRNMDPAASFDKLKSVVTGSSEPVEEIGLDFRVASLEAYAMSKGITKSWKDMSNAEQIMVRYKYTMEKTKDMQGDFKKTNDGFANGLRILKGNFQSAGANIATIFLPPLNKVLQTFNGFMSSKNIEWITNKVKELSAGFETWLTPKLKEFKAFAESSLIPKFKDIGNSMQNISKEYGPAIGEAFGAVKECAGNLAEFGLNIVHKGLNWFEENKDVVHGALGFIKDSFKMVSDFIDGDFKGAFENASSAVINLIDSFSDLTLQMRNSDNPLLKYLIGPALDIPVSIIDGASKGDINRIIGDPEEVLKKKREDRAKSREINKNHNEMIDYYKNKYKDVKEDSHGTAMPQFAKGTQFAPKGTALVGEKGPELINFRGGENVIPADKTKKILSKLPAYKKGTYFASKGVSVVGEKGPELINFKEPLKDVRGNEINIVNHIKDFLNNIKIPKFNIPTSKEIIEKNRETFTNKILERNNTFITENIRKYKENNIREISENHTLRETFDNVKNNTKETINNKEVVSHVKETERIEGKTSGGHTFIINFNGPTYGEEEFFNKAGEFIVNKITVALKNM